MGDTIQDVGDLVYSLKVGTQGISGKARIAEVNRAGRRGITPSFILYQNKDRLSGGATGTRPLDTFNEANKARWLNRTPEN